MKKLSIAPISDIARFPFKKGTLQFMQDMHNETLADTIIALIGPGYSPAVVYVMSGVILTGIAPSYAITSGTIFYAGEVFEISATSFTSTLPNVAVFQTVQTQFTTDADPVTFTDFTTRNVHNIVKMQLVAGASGSGIADVSQLYRLSFTIPQKLNLMRQLGVVGTTDYSDNILQILGVYPDLSLYVPAPATSLHPILAIGSYNIGDPGAGINNYTVTFTTALATASYTIVGCFVSNGSSSIDTSLIWTIANRLTTGFQLNVRELTGSAIQNVAFEYTIIGK